MSTALAYKEPEIQAPTRRPNTTPASAGSILDAIIAASSSADVDADKLERLMSMYERIETDQAKRAYMAALPLMQAELPIINENGGITDRSGKVQSRYAKWEDINEAIGPVLREHGFGLSFRLSAAADGRQNITAVLSHCGGHQEETTITLMHDSSGSKNAVQAVGSAVSYGQRYTARALLNFQSRAKEDRDDGGVKAGAPASISEDQVIEIRDALMGMRVNEATFCRAMKVDRLSDIAATQLSHAWASIRRKQAELSKQAGG
ncbi:ERF family protein [Castellaniella sp.]|uniref:ERF family protein n=1 Tax=Castellaniella sp. TaxID=1955812 RepID=UPI002AFE2BE6|nr:ERF family protein [Castellaniella sp.]